MYFRNAVKHFSHFITEGSIIERLKREFQYPLDDALLNTLMIYDEKGKNFLEKIYREYVEIAKAANLPFCY